MAEAATLAIDIGNTNTVLGLFQGGAITRRWRLGTRKDHTQDEIALQLELLARAGSVKGRLEAVAMASVVPGLDEAWIAAVEGVFGKPPETLDYSNCLGLKLDYEFPRQIGADRLANVLGAHALGHEEGIVIDLGTATTYDVFGKDTYWGGIICAGIQTTMRTLAQNASKLFEVDLRWSEGFVGKTTEDALRIGLLGGTVGQVEYLIKGITKEMRMRKPSVIATGGLAPVLKGKSGAIGFLEPDLTLIGINHLLLGRKKKSKGKR